MATSALPSLLFAVFAYDLEAVYWISGRNSIMAGLAAVIATMLYCSNPGCNAEEGPALLA